MIIEVFGRTDRRPVIYTLMNVLQKLGDTCLLTDNVHYTRITENNSRFGYCQNVAIFITDTPADEVFEEIGHSPNDYDYVIADNKDFPESACVLYAEGLGPEESDRELLAAMPDAKVIKMGKGSARIAQTLEEIEYYRTFKPVDERVTREVLNVLSSVTNTDLKTLLKAANGK